MFRGYRRDLSTLIGLLVLNFKKLLRGEAISVELVIVVLDLSRQREDYTKKVLVC
jgi:hypothetical protein